VKKPAPLLVYTVLRLLAFLVPLAILWFFFPIFREFWWLAAIFAALIGVSISMLFLRTPLTNASTRLQERREARVGGEQVDADAEDEAVDGAATGPERPRED
jgi:ABC-type siderophore export system fused ATPase/permease subunit